MYPSPLPPLPVIISQQISSKKQRFRQFYTNVTFEAIKTSFLSYLSRRLEFVVVVVNFHSSFFFQMKGLDSQNTFISISRSLSLEPLSEFLSNLAKIIHGWKGIQVCSKERSFQGKIITKGRKLKIAFYRTIGPISTKLCAKHSWVMGT